MKTFSRMTILLAAVFYMAADANGSEQVGLDVPFHPDRQCYNATVASDVTEITVVARPRHPSATVSVNGGDAATPVPLAPGENTVVVVVTAEDGQTQRIYTLKVTRLLAGNTGANADGGCPDEDGPAVADDATQGPPPTVSLTAAPSTVHEGSALTVTVRLSAALANGVTIPLTVTRATSETGDHGTLTGIVIPAGFLQGTATIATSHDADTDDERFTVALGTLPAAVGPGSPAAATVTIADDDPPAQPLVGDPTPPTGSPHAALIDNVKAWRNDARYSADPAHTNRWDRVLLALGETVHTSGLTAMTAAEAQGYADRGWERWQGVADALQQIEGGATQPAPSQDSNDQQPLAQAPPGPLHAAFIAMASETRDDPLKSLHQAHVDRWDRVLLALGEPVSDTSLTPMTVAEAQGFVDQGWTPWNAVVQALNAVITGTSTNDTLTGTSSGELLGGLAGDDDLSGLGGDDELRGGDGADTYSGGEGRDRFVFFFGDTCAKVITDFATGDVIVLKGSGWPSVSDITGYVTAVGSIGYRHNLAGGLTLETTNNRSLRTEDILLED